MLTTKCTTPETYACHMCWQAFEQDDLSWGPEPGSVVCVDCGRLPRVPPALYQRHIDRLTCELRQARLLLAGFAEFERNMIARLQAVEATAR